MKSRNKVKEQGNVVTYRCATGSITEIFILIKREKRKMWPDNDGGLWYCDDDGRERHVY